MKLPSKTISSPARTDKFPPPLMRFLRSNASSRSRRSKSSPMFVLRKKNNNNNIETTQEPSSPKVTCMGQVRAKRSSKSNPTHRTWIKKPNTCSCRPVWPIWAFFHRKSPKPKQPDEFVSISISNSNIKKEIFSVGNYNQNQNHNHNHNAIPSASTSTSNACSPPKNALLLTRCRSAPYRSSSLASRFWSSPLRNEETESTSDNEKSSSQSLNRDSVSEDSVGTERFGSVRDFENVEELLLKGRVKKEEDEDSAVVARPLVLTRCKSEPARVDYRIDPEVNSMWKKTRLGFAVASSPLHVLSD
ncbi:unnamed protein product [Vicia faba]|uniref:Uncharacterized protein n=1 Tax=Vicia faba TaxID=3906 RepID=A0AAV1AVZ4_VICFA|nr:unnamed protein product [Vicia faba]